MSTTAPNPSPAHTSILIVDDIPANLQLLAEILKDSGHDIHAALSGRLALQAIQSTRPSLILLDINMPDISGFEVCRRLKADPATADIPVIFVSALNDTKDKVQAFALGCVDYIPKPFQAAEVLARVNTHLALRRQQLELERQYARLRSLEELRDNLVHMIVHDMRNPLWSINGYLELIREARNKPGPVLEFTGEALAAANILIEMISSILDVSKMEAGQIPLALGECDLGQLVREAIQKAGPAQQSRRLTLDGPEESATVIADCGLIGRVIGNLLSNALAYTAENAGEIRFRIEPSGGYIRVSIEDNGQGVPPELHERIFEKFFQVRSTLSGDRHSIGLGLTFCKLAVEAHGGHIGVTSDGEHGSTFWFDLPVRGPVPGA